MLTLAGAMEITSTVQLLERDKVTSNSTTPAVSDGVSQSCRRKNPNPSSNSKNTCFRCCKKGPKADDKSCPALGKTYRVCHKDEHFASSKYCL